MNLLVIDGMVGITSAPSSTNRSQQHQENEEEKKKLDFQFPKNGPIADALLL